MFCCGVFVVLSVDLYVWGGEFRTSASYFHICFCDCVLSDSNAASLSEYENTISCFREHRFCYLKKAPAICLCLTRALEQIFDQHPLGICPAVTAPVSVLSNKTCPDLSNTFSKPQSYMFKQMRYHPSFLSQIRKANPNLQRRPLHRQINRHPRPHILTPPPRPGASPSRHPRHRIIRNGRTGAPARLERADSVPREQRRTDGLMYQKFRVIDPPFHVHNNTSS